MCLCVSTSLVLLIFSLTSVSMVHSYRTNIHLDIINMTEGTEAHRHLNNIEVSIAEIEKICKGIEIHEASSVNNISSRILKVHS